MLRIKNLNIPFNDETPLIEHVAKKLKIAKGDIKNIQIVRKAIDARRYKNAPIYFVYILDVDLSINESKYLKKNRDKNIEPAVKREDFAPKNITKAKKRPVVIGFGPAGMIAGYYLALYGFSPIIFERGSEVEKRKKAIDNFWDKGIFSKSTNVQFGEGGAGTFSDGKLTTRISDDKIGDVLDLFISCGAPKEIKYLHKPHIGTDILIHLVKNLRSKIISLGGEIHFDSQITNMDIEDDRIKTIEINHKDTIEVDTVFLGIGHSARDTYEMLYKNNVAMEQKPFAVGVRIEHPQSIIDESQYGIDFKNPLLPVADYALTYNNRDKNRSVYSFCMCPGGYVVGAASEEEMLVVNGMSNYRRNSGIANSALLVNVSAKDFGSGILDGIVFQRKYESLAYNLGGKNYHAPVQRVEDFLKDRVSSDKFLTNPTYKPGVTLANLKDCLPNVVVEMIKEALPNFDKKIPGFMHNDAVITGVEMRSSAPVRIVRDKESYISTSTQNLYPIGEGAGYAGGIMSSAIDGLNSVLAFIINENKKA